MSRCFYKEYDAVTPEVLDTVKVGDKVRINGWKMPLTVKGVSEHFFVMARNAFKKSIYSVVDKEAVFAGPDNYVFGHPLCTDHEGLYFFSDEQATEEYLNSFEIGEVEVSQRRGVKIESMSIRRYCDEK